MNRPHPTGPYGPQQYPPPQQYAQPPQQYAQPPQQYAQPRQPMQYPPAPPGQAPRRHRWLLWVGLALAAGVMALAMVVAAVVVLAPPRTTPGEQVVADYLHAIARADAKTALALLEERPADTSLISDEVLQQSQALAPLTVDEVSHGAGNGADGVLQMAKITLGGVPTLWFFDAVQTPAGWRIRNGVNTVVNFDFDHAPYGVRVNGAEPTNVNDFAILPGVYQATTDSSFVTFVEDGRFDGEDMGLPAMQMTAAGEALAKGAVGRHLEQCVKSTAKAPEGCPFSARPMGEVVGGYHWQLSSEPEITVRTGQPLTSEGTVNVSVGYDIKLEYRSRNGRGTKENANTWRDTATAQLDMSTTSPKITFS
ncbi:hypothetical protein ACQBAR_00450 [Propionibacteriaceae bacterium Y1685]